MHDGDRSNEPATLGAFGYFTAIVACCFIVGVLTYALGRENERRYQAPASYAKAAKSDAQSACAGREGTAAFECIYEKVEAAQEQARGEQDLTAQQVAANSAFMSAIIAFFTLILTGVGVWFVKRTLEATLEAVEDTGNATLAMQEANTIARDIGQAQVKCYLSGIRAELVMMMRPEFHVDVVIENFGASPARNVSWDGELRFSTNNLIDSRVVPKRQIRETFETDIPAQSTETVSFIFDGIINDTERTVVRNSEFLIHLTVTITYEDIFENVATITEQFSVFPDGGMPHGQAIELTRTKRVRAAK